ncbi:MAG: DNA primase [Clostridia bacterium]
MVRYSDELIDEIRNGNDIVDVISQYVVLKRSGRNFFGLCPFHKEKSPSFSVSPDKQIFHCFGCGVGGNVFHFVSKIENLNFKETVEMLADRCGVSLPLLDNEGDSKTALLKSKVYEINTIAANFYHENLYKPSAKPAQEYVKKRKLDNATLKNFLIGYAGNYNELATLLLQKGYTEEEMLASSLVNKTPDGKYIDRFRKRLMFPIQDVRNRVIAFGGRVLDDSKPKYINSPENVVYSKGRHLFGLNVAKRGDLKKIIIVEGYMDAISLHQRGITNAVASLGTAMTEAQGRLLRKSSEQVIIGYDSDGAGQAATMRGLEILQNLGCDIRILQLEGAKDPDEFVVKYGPERFEKEVDKSISLVEYKVKMLQKDLKLDQANDKIKFLKEIAKVLSKMDNEIEQEVYAEKIAKTYQISKEAIYAEIKKLDSPISQGTKTLEKTKPRLEDKKQEENVQNEQIDRRERLIIYFLVNYPEESYAILKQYIKPEDLKNERNQNILKKLYEEFEKGNSNTNNVLDWFTEEETINYLSWIMAYDFEIAEIDKGIEDVLRSYQKERVIAKRNEIIKQLENKNLTKEETHALENKLNDIIIQLAKMK